MLKATKAAMTRLESVEVLFSDAALLVVDKPAGLRTLPDGYDPTLPHIRSLLEQEYGRLWIVHRLDKDTSGVLLIARTAQAHRLLNTQFEQHQVSKVYHALVKGNPGWEQETISLPLRANGDRSHRTVVDLEEGKPASTRLRVLERLAAGCLLEAIPETGRTHQIRAHLSSAGLSILGDRLYQPVISIPLHEAGDDAQPGEQHSMIRIERVMLHARRLEFVHPTSLEKMIFEATYPDDFSAVLNGLRSGSTLA